MVFLLSTQQFLQHAIDIILSSSRDVKLSLKKLLIQDNFHTKLMIGLYQKLILMHNDVRCMLIICDQLKV